MKTIFRSLVANARDLQYYAPPDGIFSGSPPAAKDVCRVNVPAFQVWENTTSTCTFKPSGVKFKATLGPFLRDGDDNATGYVEPRRGDLLLAP